MMQVIKSVKKITKEKFINLYKANYLVGKNKYPYLIASRRDIKNLSINTKNKITDAVTILPYIVENDEISVIITKEFRYAVNDYVYSLPAGLVDPGENIAESAMRELKEEIGGDILILEQITNCGYTSEGFTDESLVCFKAQVKLGENNLEAFEDINIEIVKLKDILVYTENKNFNLVSLLLLKNFYLENFTK